MYQENEFQNYVYPLNRFIFFETEIKFSPGIYPNS